MTTLRKSLLLAISLGLAPASTLADDGASEAVFSWSGHGQLFQTSASEIDFMGVIEGVLYLEKAGGELDEAFMECSFRNSLNTKAQSSVADGKCVIVQSPKDTITASFTCQGQTSVCAGELTFNSGTGQFKGIQGGAKAMFRSPLRLLAPSLAGGEELTVANGVALFTDIDYTQE